MKGLGRDAMQQKIDRGSALAGRLASAWQHISGFVRRSAVRRDDLAELNRYGGCNVILQDMGITQSDIGTFVRGSPEAGQLFTAMAKHLRIAVDELVSPMRYELRLACVTCPSQRQCRRWLASGDKSPDSPTFCANGALFDAVLNPGQPL